VLFGQPGGGFGSRRDVPLPAGPDQLVAADFNGDGAPDLAVACGASGEVSVVYGPFGGGAPIQRGYAFGGVQLTGLAAGDFNADGALDLACGINPDQVRVLANLGGAPRIFGRINVNTAPAAVLQAAFKNDPDLMKAPPEGLGINPAAAAAAIVAERTANGPFTSLDDFFGRMAPTLVPALGGTYGFRSEAMARFMANLLTVRTDVWGVRARVQLFRDLNDDGKRDPGEEILGDRSFYMVLDRSQNPIRTVLKRYAAE